MAAVEPSGVEDAARAVQAAAEELRVTTQDARLEAAAGIAKDTAAEAVKASLAADVAAAGASKSEPGAAAAAAAAAAVEQASPCAGPLPQLPRARQCAPRPSRIFWEGRRRVGREGAQPARPPLGRVAQPTTRASPRRRKTAQFN
jgi:hypothetical protein